MAALPYADETYRIIGACFSVYNELGCGFLEPVYQECLEIELASQGIPFEAQKTLPIYYKGHRLKKTYEPDFICFGEVLLEIKACSDIADEHRAQLINYLHGSGLEIGLLVNFGHYPKLQFGRYANLQGGGESGPRMVREAPVEYRTLASGQFAACLPGTPLPSS